MSFDEIDEDRRRRFEQARRSDAAVRLEAFLPEPDVPGYVPTLEELVLIDLEFGWKAAAAGSPGPQVESYLERFPRLRDDEIVLRLLRYEFELRKSRGPTPSLDEYRKRFPIQIRSGRELIDGGPSLLTPGGGPTHQSDVKPADDGHVLLRTSDAGEPEARYSLTRLHAEGGLGRIWVAHDDDLDRDVALKELKPHSAHDADAWKRFLREAQVTGRLEHPNIVPVYELIHRDENRPPFYTMRLVKGLTLREAIARYHDRRRAKQDDPLELPRLLQAFVSVCQAISYAHSRGVIHRDIKPDNIILGDFGEVLVLDWGLAKARTQLGSDEKSADAAMAEAPLAADLTSAGSVVGTLAYMAPEQAAGSSDKVDERSDIFGLGGVLFEILTGSPPRMAQNVNRLLADAIHRPIYPARRLNADVPVTLDAVCARATAYAPGDRYAAAVDLASDVQRYLADEPTTAYREPWTRRVARWSRKHRTAVAVLAAVTILSTLAAVGGLFVRQHYENERRLAEARRIADIRAQATIDETLALNELRQNRFTTALELLTRTERQLNALPEPDRPQEPFRARVERVRRIESFYRGIETGEQLEFFEYDDQAERAVESALRTLGVLETPEWWKRIPTDDLTTEQAERLREDVFRQLLLLGSIRAKRGLIDFGSAESADVYRSVLKLSEQASAWRPSQSARVLEVFARVGLGPREVLKLKWGPAVEPTSQADLYYVGLMHLWAGQSDAVGKLLTLLTPLIGMDFSDSPATSERMMRAAVARDPSHFWTWFFLGWAKMHARDFTSAELVFDTCIALQPKSAIAHSYRGLTLVLRAQGLKDSPAEDAEIRRGVADGERAEQLDPLNPEIVALHSRILANAGRKDDAQVVVLRALDLEPELQAWKGQRVLVDKESYLRDARQLALNQLKDAPNSLEARQLVAETQWRFGDAAEAELAAQEVLRLRPADPRGLTIRGRCALARGDTASALRDFEQVVAANPRDWAAVVGRADAYLAAGDFDRARSAYDVAVDVARVDWQKVRALLGRVRVLQALGRNAEAETAWDAARALDPRAVDPRPSTGK